MQRQEPSTLAKARVSPCSRTRAKAVFPEHGERTRKAGSNQTEFRKRQVEGFGGFGSQAPPFPLNSFGRRISSGRTLESRALPPLVSGDKI